VSVARVEQVTVFERDYDDLLAEFRDELVIDGMNLDNREAVVRAVWEYAGAGAFDQQGSAQVAASVLDA
jgi:hypothetical protein